MPWAVDIPSIEEYEVIVRKGHHRFLAREDLWLLLFLKGTDTLVGGSGLHRIDWSVPKFEIGYWVRTHYARQGYITEAVKGITTFALQTLGAKRVEIRCDALNERSAAVPRRLGFTYEGTLIADERHHLTGDLRDTMIFARIAS
jgi:RimJ/RimL family protein N-acetyltransferase